MVSCRDFDRMEQEHEDRLRLYRALRELQAEAFRHKFGPGMRVERISQPSLPDDLTIWPA